MEVDLINCIPSEIEKEIEKGNFKVEQVAGDRVFISTGIDGRADVMVTLKIERMGEFFPGA